jgi:putative transposase
MTCPHCSSSAIRERRRRTALGYLCFTCRSCGRRCNERTRTPFNDLQFPTDVVLLAVLWRLRYKLGFRDVAELLLQRGYDVTHETIRLWEFRFAPLVRTRLRARRRGHGGRSWYIDETYVKVSGRWRYLYRAIDRDGNLLDSMLSAQRDKAAARAFLRRLLAMTPQKPLRVTTDKHPAYQKAIRWIVGRTVLHRQSQYLNNRIEQDHRALKQRYYPMLGFGRLASAERFCAAFEELRHYLRVKPELTLAERRLVFVNRWRALLAELAA